MVGRGWEVLIVGAIFDALICCRGMVLYIIGTVIAVGFVGTGFDSAEIVVIGGEYKKKYIA